MGRKPRPPEVDGLRPCTRCGRRLPNTAEYYQVKDKTTGQLRAACRDCSRIQTRNYETQRREINRQHKRRIREGLRACKRCHQELPLDAFDTYEDETGQTRRRGSCRECRNHDPAKFAAAVGYCPPWLPPAADEHLAYCAACGWAWGNGRCRCGAEWAQVIRPARMCGDVGA